MYTLPTPAQSKDAAPRKKRAASQNDHLSSKRPAGKAPGVPLQLRGCGDCETGVRSQPRQADAVQVMKMTDQDTPSARRSARHIEARQHMLFFFLHYQANAHYIYFLVIPLPWDVFPRRAGLLPWTPGRRTLERCPGHPAPMKAVTVVSPAGFPWDCEWPSQQLEESVPVAALGPWAGPVVQRTAPLARNTEGLCLLETSLISASFKTDDGSVMLLFPDIIGGNDLLS